MMIKALFAALVILTLGSCVGVSDDYGYGYQRPVYVYPGIGLGTVIAVVVSWSRNKSIIWAIIHGLFGWFYVLYALFVKRTG